MERRGRGVLATGCACALRVPAGADQACEAARLAATALDSGSAPPGLVAGALPYRGDAPASLVIPEAVVVTWPADHESGASPAPPPASEGGGSSDLPSWSAEPPAPAFVAAVEVALRRIRAGELEKVVLARSLVADNPGLDLRALLAELRRRDPASHLFAAASDDGGVFLGATPETLVRRRGTEVLSIPHAGTAPRSRDPSEDRRSARGLLSSAKERHEHRVVVEAVADSLAPHCTELHVDAEPRAMATASVWHLASAVRGRLRSSAPGALGLAAALHPTPAVCGMPPSAAAALIDHLEPAGRGLYAGLVGWMDRRGDGEWAVSLRCALVTPQRIRLHAGVGIVAGSDPRRELAETAAKFHTLLDALAAVGTAAVPVGGR
jgi:isochorismate synthase